MNSIIALLISFEINIWFDSQTSKTKLQVEGDEFPVFLASKISISLKQPGKLIKWSFKGIATYFIMYLS